ncbi:MAG TPA: adenylate/guanylate cyclase domain-containing protein [Acidimicrobiales bacterium]|nr:adenylate/guanylate cyclase domain-containing protein [Acidimicrobiales bacterium]
MTAQPARPGPSRPADDLAPLSPELGENQAAREARHLTRLGADLVLQQRLDLDVESAASRAGTDSSTFLELWKTLGVDVSVPETLRFSELDAALTRSLCAPDNFGDRGGDELLRVVGQALAQVAEAAVSFYVQDVEPHLLQDDLPTVDLAQHQAHAATKALEIGDGLGALFRHHLMDAISRQRTTQVDQKDPVVSRLAVGFVDLVGFTAMSHELSSRQLSQFVVDFEARAFRTTAESNARVVKHVGDEVMFVAFTADQACRVALDLVSEFTDVGVQPRGGLAFGHVLSRHGDYYGPVVNLAARLADLAVPGEVLVAPEVAKTASSSAISFEPAGRRQLKGFPHPVAVHSLLRTSPPPPS